MQIYIQQKVYRLIGCVLRVGIRRKHSYLVLKKFNVQMKMDILSRFHKTANNKFTFQEKN